jgi:arylsulfatase A-like enzyme
MVRQEPQHPRLASSQAGPFDLWPPGLGFEYFYGFIGGDSSQWAPALYENIHVSGMS